MILMRLQHLSRKDIPYTAISISVPWRISGIIMMHTVTWLLESMSIGMKKHRRMIQNTFVIIWKDMHHKAQIFICWNNPGILRRGTC